MPFAKGHKKMGGRTSDSIIVSQAEKQGLVNYLKEAGADRFIDALKALDDKDFCKYYVPVIEIAFPKLSRTEVTGKDGKDLLPQPILDVTIVQKNDSYEEDNGDDKAD